MFFWFFFVCYVILLLLLVGKQTGMCLTKFTLPYGDGRRRDRTQPQATRRIESADTDPYHSIKVSPVEGPLVFTPDLTQATVTVGQVQYFQTKLKLAPGHTLYQLDTDFSFSRPGAVLGFYLEHLELFNETVEDLQHRDGPFLVELKPNEVLSISVRNRGSEPLSIDRLVVKFTKKR
jgi:hypothetical protein